MSLPLKDKENNENINKDNNDLALNNFNESNKELIHNANSSPLEKKIENKQELKKDNKINKNTKSTETYASSYIFQVKYN